MKRAKRKVRKNSNGIFKWLNGEKENGSNSIEIEEGDIPKPGSLAPIFIRGGVESKDEIILVQDTMEDKIGHESSDDEVKCLAKIKRTPNVPSGKKLGVKVAKGGVWKGFTAQKIMKDCDIGQKVTAEFMQEIQQRRLQDQIFMEGKTVNPFFSKRVRLNSDSESGQYLYEGVDWLLPEFSCLRVDGGVDAMPNDISNVLENPWKVKGPHTNGMVIDDHVEEFSFCESRLPNAFKRLETLLAVFNDSESTMKDLSEDSPTARTIANMKKRSNMSEDCSLWVDIFRPVELEYRCGYKQHDTGGVLAGWLKEWKAFHEGRESEMTFDNAYYATDDDGQKRLKNLISIHGKQCSGKSTIVHAVASHLGFRVIELNSSQLRSGKAIMAQIGEATQSDRISNKEDIGIIDLDTSDEELDNDNYQPEKRKTAKGKKRKELRDAIERRRLKQGQKMQSTEQSEKSIILFDDVDYLFPQDKGFMSTLGKLIQSAKCPLIATCCDYPKNFPESSEYLYKTLELPDEGDSQQWLQSIGVVQKIPISHVQAQLILERTNYDIRKSTHFLQYWKIGGTSVSIYKPCDDDIVLGCKNDPRMMYDMYVRTLNDTVNYSSLNSQEAVGDLDSKIKLRGPNEHNREALESLSEASILAECISIQDALDTKCSIARVNLQTYESYAIPEAYEQFGHGISDYAVNITKTGVPSSSHLPRKAQAVQSRVDCLKTIFMEQYARMKCQKGKSELIAAIEESYLDAHGTQILTRADSKCFSVDQVPSIYHMLQAASKIVVVQGRRTRNSKCKPISPLKHILDYEALSKVQLFSYDHLQ